MRIFGISVPKDTVWNPHAATTLIRSLLEDKKISNDALQFRIRATEHGIGFFLGFYQQAVDALYLQALVRAFYPQAEVYLTEQPHYSFPVHRRTIIFDRKTQLYYQRALTADQLADPDPLSLFTQTVGDLLPHEHMEYSLNMYRRIQFTEKEIKDMLTQSWAEAGRESHVTPAGDGLMDAFAAGVAQGLLDSFKRTARFSPTEEKWYRAKLTQFVYMMFCTLSFDSPDPARLQLFTAAQSAIQLFLPVHNATVPSVIVQTEDELNTTLPYIAFWNLWEDSRAEKNKKRSAEKWTRIEQNQFYLIPEEIASLWHLPHKGFEGQKVHWLRGSQVRLPEALAGQRSGMCLGINTYGGRLKRVFIQDRDRATHMTIIGKTGTGKSTLLHNLIHQDILNHRGVAVIDPHGDLVRAILQRSIPEERKDDVVVIDLANETYPPPLNLLAVPKDSEPMSTAGQVVSLIERMTGRLSETPRVADTLTMALVTLWQEKSPTLLDVDRLFDDLDYRTQLVHKANNIAVSRFWERFDRQTTAQQQELTYPVIYRMRSFYGNPTLLPMMCHPDTLDLAALIAHRKIILISLAADDKKIPPREQALFGAIMMSALQTGLSRFEAVSSLFSLYIDEAQRFVTTSLPELFETARKRGLSLVLANQYFKQLAGDTIEAVMGNVGAIVAFQCGHDDARVLSPYFKPGFDAEDLVQLDQYQAAIWMRHEGQTQPAFSLSPLPPIKLNEPDKAVQREHYIRQLSEQRYTPKSREDVLQWINQRYSSPAPSSYDDLYDPL